MKYCFALVLSGLLLLGSFAFAENDEWSNYYLSLDSYPPIVFDENIYEGISGPPGGALLRIEGIVWEEEKFPNHLSLYVKTDSGEKWALSWLDVEDDHVLLGERIEAYGTYTGIAPVPIQDTSYDFIPSMCVIRYVLNGETINPKVTEAEFFFNDEWREKYSGKYRYEVFEGKSVSESKDLLGGLFLYHENN